MVKKIEIKSFDDIKNELTDLRQNFIATVDGITSNPDIDDLATIGAMITEKYYEGKNVLESIIKKQTATDIIHSYIDQKWIPNALEKKAINYLLDEAIDGAVKAFNKYGGKKWILKVVGFFGKIKNILMSIFD